MDQFDLAPTQDMLNSHSIWTRSQIRFSALAFIAVMSAAFLASRLTAVNGVDCCGNGLFPDFAQVYVPGEYLLHNQGRSLYEQKPFSQEVNRILNVPNFSGVGLIYPPVIAVLGAPWALMPYPVAAWTHALLSILAACYLARDMARYFFGKTDDAIIATLLFLAFLPLWRVWMFGQNSVWALAILWGSWRLWSSGAGFASGILLALGLYKPHLFLGAWVWAMLWGNRRLRSGLILGLAGGVVLGMIGGGCSAWFQWLNALRETTGFVEHIEWMTSLPHAWKLLGGEYLFGSASIYVVLIVAFAVWGMILLELKRKSAGCPAYTQGDSPIFADTKIGTVSRNALPTFALCFALLGGWILTPRVYVYDWILVWPVMLAAWKYGTDRMRQVIAWGGLLFWIHDAFGMMHVPILTLAGVAVFVWLVCQTLRENCDVVRGTMNNDATRTRRVQSHY